MENMNMNQFLDGLASDAPAPGGGSVAGLCGALSAALVSMVANLTVGKEKHSENWEAMEDANKEAVALRREFTTLMQKDIEAFNSYMAAVKLPRETEEEKTERKTAISAAIKNSTVVPMLTLEACLRASALARKATEAGNPNVITDAGAAAALAEAAAKISTFNVRANLAYLDDEFFAYKCITKACGILETVKHDYTVIEKEILKRTK